MREIKFRAWSVAHKYMTTQIEWSGGRFWLDTRDDGVEVGKEDFPVMQFTGLKDKNGKEIWEGDILKLSRYWADHFGRETTEIFFEKGAFRFAHNRVIEYEVGIIGEESEVLGNIYEHPELLEAKP